MPEVAWYILRYYGLEGHENLRQDKGHLLKSQASLEILRNHGLEVPGTAGHSTRLFFQYPENCRTFLWNEGGGVESRYKLKPGYLQRRRISISSAGHQTC